MFSKKTFKCISPKDIKTLSGLYNPNTKDDMRSKVALWKGDITKLKFDAIVNAANRSLCGGGGVDGAIHAAAGSQLLEECKELGGCETGEAKITKGYKLPAKHVIHTVGPIGEHTTELRDCYQNSLELLAEHNLRTIAFPCISTGIYGYPNEAAAHVALHTTKKWLQVNIAKVDLIVFCLFLPVDVSIYKNLAEMYFSKSQENTVEEEGAVAEDGARKEVKRQREADKVENSAEKKTAFVGEGPETDSDQKSQISNEQEVHEKQAVVEETPMSQSEVPLSDTAMETDESTAKLDRNDDGKPAEMQESENEEDTPTTELSDEKRRELIANFERQEPDLIKKLVQTDGREWMSSGDENGGFPLLERVGGLDISYHINKSNVACVSLVVLSFPDLEIIYEDTSEVEIDVPYIPGYLAYREVKYYRDKIEKVKGTDKEPQIVLVDGNGILHPRRFGSACCIGVMCDIPAIGMAKNLFVMPEQGVNRDDEFLNKVRQAEEISINIETNTGEILGKAVKSSKDSKKPIYISVGHLCSLETAVSITLACSRFRVPEPVRQADVRSKSYLQKKYRLDYEAYHNSKKSPQNSQNNP